MRVPAVLLACLAICIATGCGGAKRPNGWGHAPLIRAPALAGPELAVLRATPDGGTSKVDLLVMTREGRLLRVLAGDSISKTLRPAFGDRPGWSPDGRRIAFSGVSGQGSSRFAANAKPDVFVVDADGSRLRRLTHSGDVSGPVWSQDGKWIVFERQFGRDYPWRFALWMIRPDGSDARQILPAVKARVVVPGSFSPDGSTVAVTISQLVPPAHNGRLRSPVGVYVVGANGSVDKVADQASTPTFSPNGKLLAFVTNRDRNGDVMAGEDEVDYAGELYVMDTDGGNVRRMTRTREVDEGAPSWSPDGTVLAYVVSGSSYTRHVLLVNADGSCTTPLTFDDTLDPSYDAPAWRPGLPRRGGGRLTCRS